MYSYVVSICMYEVTQYYSYVYIAIYTYIASYSDFITAVTSLQFQRTPLHIAIYKDNASLVKRLKSLGADINASIVSSSCALKLCNLCM